MKRRLLLLVGILAASSAWANPAPPTPEKLAALRAHSEQVLARAKDVEGVFEVQEDGQIKHLQSGLICPAEYPNAELYNFLVYTSAAGKGLDVGCDYRRPDKLGGASAKFTVYATKASPTTTLDSAFDGYRKEIAEGNKNVRAQGPSLRMSGSPPPDFPEFRSEEYLLTWNDRDYTSQLIVTIVSGWVIEVRATFEGLPNEIKVAPTDTAQSAETMVQDRATADMTFMRTIGMIGK